jgi:hypothetical protein
VRRVGRLALRMPRPRVHIERDPIMKEKHEKALDKLRAELLAIPEAVRGDYFRRFRRHSYSARLDANDAVRDALGRVACAQTYLLVLSGNDASNDAGKATIPVHRLLCGAMSEDRESAWPLVPIREPSFVATPQGAAPAMLTVTPRLTPVAVGGGHFLSGRGGASLDLGDYLSEIVIDVSTWRHDGAPAGNVAFSWMCTIEAAELVFIGG